MIDTFEMVRRQRPDVCSACGWGLVQDDRGWECANPYCGVHDGVTHFTYREPEEKEMIA